MEKIYLKHKDWINVVISFGCNKYTAEDIVQEMYIKIMLMINKGLDITYNDDDVNHYYVYRTLKSLFLDLKRKESKCTYVNVDDCYNLKQDSYVDYNIIDKELDNLLSNLHWYDKKVYELLQDMSISELSRTTKIDYHSLRNTNIKVKKYLKSKLKL